MTKPSARLPQLDGLRGLAALSVFISHVIECIPGSRSMAIQHTPLHLLWEGRAAVIVFFLLSGFVLSLPFVGPDVHPLRPVTFILKRFFRLYPAYWVALAVALLLRTWILAHNHLASLDPWASSVWNLPITPGLLARLALMIYPGMSTLGVDPVIWSLVIEMKISILFPAILFLVRRSHSLRIDLALLALALLLGPLRAALGILPVFLAGSYLAKYRQPLAAWIAKRSHAQAALLLALALACYGFGNYVAQPDTYPVTLVTACGAALLVLLVLAWTPARRIASARPVTFMGAVSYSFYLLHLPILIAVASALLPFTRSLLVCGSVALALSLLAAWLSYRCIELPGIRLGAMMLAKRSLPAANQASAHQ